MSSTSEYDLDSLLAEVQATPGSALVETFMSSDESQGPALKPLLLAAGFKLRHEKPHPAGPSTQAGTYNTYTAGPETARKLPQLMQLAMRNKREIILLSFANPELASAISTEISGQKLPLHDILQTGSTNTPTSNHRGSSTTPAASLSASASVSAQPAAGNDTATNARSISCGSSSANAPSSSSRGSRGGGGIAAGFLNRAGSRTAAARDQTTARTPGAAVGHSSKSSNSSVCDTQASPVVVSDVGSRGRDQDRPQATGTPKAPATDKNPSPGPTWDPYAMHQVAPVPPTLVTGLTLSAPAAAPAAAAGQATALLTQLAAMKVTSPPGNTSSSTASGSSTPQAAGAAGVPHTDSTFAGCGAAQRPPLRRSREHMNMDMNSTAAALPGDAPSREGFTAAGRGSGGGSSSSSFGPFGEESGSGFTVGASGGRGDVGRGSSSSRRRRVKAVRSRSGS